MAVTLNKKRKKRVRSFVHSHFALFLHLPNKQNRKTGIVCTKGKIFYQSKTLLYNMACEGEKKSPSNHT